jgi:hypothetical protein
MVLRLDERRRDEETKRRRVDGIVVTVLIKTT